MRLFHLLLISGIVLGSSCKKEQTAQASPNPANSGVFQNDEFPCEKDETLPTDIASSDVVGSDCLDRGDDDDARVERSGYDRGDVYVDCGDTDTWRREVEDEVSSSKNDLSEQILEAKHMKALSELRSDKTGKGQRFDKLSHQTFKKKRDLLDFVNSKRSIKVVNVETKWSRSQLWKVWHLWFLEPVIV